MERTNLLNQFFSSKSDANEFLEATNQENLEKDFQNYMTNDYGEIDALFFVNEMCVESLSPDAFELWGEGAGGIKTKQEAFNKI